jgi:hypothetical protein
LAGNARILIRVQDYVDTADPDKAAILREPLSIIE